MQETVQGPIQGREYRFSGDGFVCKEWPDPVRYEDVTAASSADGSGCFDISFTTPKGKKRKVSIILDSHAQKGPLQALLVGKIPGASVHTRNQTAWEACGGWVMTGLGLAALVVVIILLNTWGRGATVSAPVWLIPFIMIGSFLSVEILAAIAAAILVIFGAGALLSLRKRKPVWEISK